MHPNRLRALDRLLDDLEDAGGAGPSPACPPDAPSQGGAAARRLRIEESLVAVVVGAHPKRRESLDRLLDDLEDDPSEQIARDAFDAACDHDFDGLG